MIRVLTNRKLPEDENEFFELMSFFFPKVYDVKYLMKSCKNLKGGLQEVADALEVSYRQAGTAEERVYFYISSALLNEFAPCVTIY